MGGVEVKEQTAKYGRYFLSLFLTYGVYTETGIFTTIFCFLTFITFEMITGILRKQGPLKTP